MSASQPSLEAGVMQVNNELSGRGGTTPVGDATRQKPIRQAWQKQSTQGLNVCPVPDPPKPLEEVLASSPLTTSYILLAMYSSVLVADTCPTAASRRLYGHFYPSPNESGGYKP